MVIIARKFLLILFSAMLLFSFSIDATAMQSYLNVSAEGAVLIDVNSGRVIYEKNPDKQMRIASLTKIMTAIVAIEYGDLSSYVKTSDNAFGVEGSSIYLQNGEKILLGDILYGLMLRSGNDAAVAIAEHVGGSVEGFAYLMNEKAAYLGMTGTYFENPHGLDADNHYSTPRDMAILTSYALKNPTFKEIVSTKVKTVPIENENWSRKWYNKNKLLYRYEWADGVKTGYTKTAKRCLASSATKNGYQLVAITLNAPDDWNDHIRMFEYGFNNYDNVVVIQEGETLWKTEEGNELVAANDLSYLLRAEEESQIKKMVNIDQDKGKVMVYLGDKYIGSVTLEMKRDETFRRKVIEVWNSYWKGE